MPAILDDQPQRFVQSRSTIPEEARGFRECADNVEDRDCLCSLLDWPEFTQSLITQFLKELVFQLAGAFVCAEYFRLYFLQLGRNEAFAADGRLLALVMRRRIRKIRFCDLDK